MTKTILILAIVAAFMVGTSMSFVVSDFEAEAKKEKANSVITQPLHPVGGKNLDINTATAGTSLLYYGEDLCQITWRPDNTINTFYIQFATETLVLDKGLCGQPSAGINLVGVGDAVFQPGDFLILQGTQEVYRQQTP